MGKEKKQGENKGEEKTEQRNGGRKAATSGGCRLQARKEGRSGSFLFLRTHSIVSRKSDPSPSSTSGGNAPPFVLRATSPEAPCTDRSTLTGPRRVPKRINVDPSKYTIYSIYHTAFITYLINSISIYCYSLYGERTVYLCIYICNDIHILIY